MSSYPSDLTPAEFRIVEPHIPWPDHPSRKWRLQIVLNSIYYILRGGNA